MTTITAAPIVSERLMLISMTPAFLEASLAGDLARAMELLDLVVPADWLDEQYLMRMRLEQLEHDPSLQPWLLRAIAIPHTRMMVGYIGFHTQPDPDYLHDLAPGGIEIGYTVFPAFRRQGYAREACAALMAWAAQDQRVTRFVLSISPNNDPSLRIAEHFGFRKVGSHIDEVDGPEDIFVRDLDPA